MLYEATKGITLHDVTSTRRSLGPWDGHPGFALAPAFESVLDALDSGALVASPGGEVRRVNAAGCDVLQLPHDLPSGTNLMTLLDPPSRQCWQQTMTQVLAGYARTGRLTINGQELLASLSAIAEQQGGAPAVLVILERAAIVTPAVRAFLETEYRLTPIECEIVDSLCQGLAPKVIARRRQVSLATIRTQVRSVLTKTQTCGVPALIAWVARIPSAQLRRSKSDP